LPAGILEDDANDVIIVCFVSDGYGATKNVTVAVEVLPLISPTGAMTEVIAKGPTGEDLDTIEQMRKVMKDAALSEDVPTLNMLATELRVLQFKNN